MLMRTLAIVAVAAVFTSDSVNAQEPFGFAVPTPPPAEVQPEASAPKAVAPTIELKENAADYRQPVVELTPRQLRTRIAQEKAAVRRAILARNAWYGHQPLRPMASAIPMMRSNYVLPYYRYTVVPVLVR